MRTSRLSDLVAVRGDDTVRRDMQSLHALPDSHDKREASEESKGFSGEAARTQSGWDYGERLHAPRSLGRRCAAAITWRNVFKRRAKGQGSALPLQRQSDSHLPAASHRIECEVHAREAERDAKVEILLEGRQSLHAGGADHVPNCEARWA